MARRLPPLLRALAAVCLLAAQGSSALHHLLAEHGRCAEHGEIVELGPARGQAGAPAAEITTDVATCADLAAGATDDHCLFVICARSSACPDRTARVAILAAQETAAPLPAADDTRLAGPPVYRVAPKNSPPA